MKRAVIIMAKVPAAGKVKTRLHALLPPEKCAELAAAFLLDALKKAETVSENVILAFAGDAGFIEKNVSPEIVRLRQQGANLGEKMAHAFASALTENSSAVMIGTDSPTFPAAYLSAAFEALESGADVVLGKARDGGFYLIGLRKNIAGLFDEIAWSSPLVFEQITRRITAKRLRLSLLAEHYDVDTPADYLHLKNEIFTDEKARKNAPETFRCLQIAEKS